MGDLSRHRAKARFNEALAQALCETDDEREMKYVYSDAIDRLADIAMDEEELERVAKEIATDPSAIDFVHE